MSKRTYDLDRPFADILSELGYRVRFAVLYAVGGWLHRLYGRVWDMAPRSPDGLAYRAWDRVLAVTGRAADTVDRLA